MTVAAVIAPRDRDEALADAAGRAAARRIVDAAWAGGALPIVVVADDPDGSIAAVLAGSPALLVAATAAGRSPYRVGADAASEAVVGTDGWLVWPGDHTWVDPETVTSLIEAHGTRPEGILRPTYEGRAGWPSLVPAGRLEEFEAALDSERGAAHSGPAAADALGAEMLDLGDPGTVITLTVAIDDVPAYVGPISPVSGPPPDWGAAAAEEPD